MHLERIATSLYDDPAAELHEDASARLREHLALPGCSILRRSSPGVRRERLPGSRWRPRGGRRGITESDRFLGTLRCRSADYGASVAYPEPAFVAPRRRRPAARDRWQT